MGKYDIITIGSSTVDVFVDTESELINISSPDMNESFIAYPSGSKILIRNISFHTGGGGTNTAVTFSRAKLKTGYIGIIGMDINAHIILENLKENKIEFLGKQKKGMTPYSVILDSIAHDRTILAYKGVADKLKYDDIRSLDAEWLYFSSMTGQSFVTLKKIIKENEEKNIAFNPSSYLVREKREETLKLLKYIDILIFNLEEAKLLLGYKEEDNIRQESLLRKIEGPKYVIITDGPNMIYARDSDCIYTLMPRRKSVRESTGAGDAFASGFVVGIIKDLGFEDSLRIGLENAESVIRYVGAQEGIISYNTIQKKVRSSRLKCRRKRL